MIEVQTLLRSLRPVDALTIAFILGVSVIALVSASQVHALLVPINIGACAGIVLISWRADASRSALPKFIHTWYPVPAIFLLFKEVYIIIQSLGRADWDAFLILADRAIFHTDPTVWLGQFASPFFTEILQIAYVSYYLIMLTLGIELYARNEREKFSYVLFTITYGFFLSYLGYLAFPAVGPRFTLHDFDALNRELPGLYVTGALRDFLNAGESIPGDIVNPIAQAQRDAFPSGHTQMTLIALFLASRYRIRSRYILYVFGTLLILSTIYLRYHYVIDLIAGAFFMAFTVWTAPKLFRWWEARRNPEPEIPAPTVAAIQSDS